MTSAAALGLIALKFSLNLDNTTVGVYLSLVASATQLYGAYVTRLTEQSEPSTVPAFSRPSMAPLAARPTGTPPVRAPQSTSGAPAVPHDLRWPETAYLLALWSPERARTRR